jgi:hypothetical protein
MSTEIQAESPREMFRFRTCGGGQPLRDAFQLRRDLQRIPYRCLCDRLGIDVATEISASQLDGRLLRLLEHHKRLGEFRDKARALFDWFALEENENSTEDMFVLFRELSDRTDEGMFLVDEHLTVWRNYIDRYFRPLVNALRDAMPSADLRNSFMYGETVGEAFCPIKGLWNRLEFFEYPVDRRVGSPESPNEIIREMVTSSSRLEPVLAGNSQADLLLFSSSNRPPLQTGIRIGVLPETELRGWLANMPSAVFSGTEVEVPAERLASQLLGHDLDWLFVAASGESDSENGTLRWSFVCQQLEMNPGTFRSYARRAGVSLPSRGQSNFVMTLADSLIAAQFIANNCVKEKHRAAALRFLQEYQVSSTESTTNVD